MQLYDPFVRWFLWTCLILAVCFWFGAAVSYCKCLWHGHYEAHRFDCLFAVIGLCLLVVVFGVILLVYRAAHP